MNTQWRTEALNTLQDIFRAQFMDDRLSITTATSPADISEWDSLAHVTLLVTAENAFGVQFTADEMGSIKDVEGLLATLERKVMA